MSAPATPASAPQPTPAPTHACARCGAPVPLDVGLCERCNPLGLRDSASSQAHGTVFLAIGGAVVALAIFAHLAVSGIGPFTASVTAVKAGDAPGSVVATLSVRNDGSSAGSATCRVFDPADRALVQSLVVYSARIAPGGTAAWDQKLDFGKPGRPLAMDCQGP
jgi:ribosomal protein L40E